MSHPRTRQNLRKARRTRCSTYLSGYIAEHPQTVPPAVALRFLQFGRKPEDLLKFMREAAIAAAARHIPEEIKQQGRSIFRHYIEAYKRRRDILVAKARRQGQRAARRAMRQSAA